MIKKTEWVKGKKKYKENGEGKRENSNKRYGKAENSKKKNRKREIKTGKENKRHYQVDQEEENGKGKKNRIEDIKIEGKGGKKNCKGNGEGKRENSSKR